MKQKEITLSVVDVPEKNFIHFQMSDPRFRYPGSITFFNVGEKVHYRKPKKNIFPAHLYLSESLLGFFCVKEVSFFWGGMDILLKGEYKSQRMRVIALLVATTKRMFPEEIIKVKYITRT